MNLKLRDSGNSLAMQNQNTAGRGKTYGKKKQKTKYS
jgi:hypothetical protein